VKYRIKALANRSLTKNNTGSPDDIEADELTRILANGIKKKILISRDPDIIEEKGG